MAEGNPKVGEIWAYRARPYTELFPVVSAEVLQFGPPRSNKVRVRYLDGEYDGLDEWVPRIRLKVPWDQVEQWLSDEQKLIEAREAYPIDQKSTEYIAVDEIFMAYPRDDALLIGFPANRGATVAVDDLDLLCTELELGKTELLKESHAFVDRFGEYIAPWPVAVMLAKRVAERFSEHVLTRLDKQRDELVKLTVPGSGPSSIAFQHEKEKADRFQNDLRRMQPALELIQKWCGEDAANRKAEIDILRDEIASVRALLELALSHLESTNQTRVASQIRWKYERIKAK